MARRLTCAAALVAAVLCVGLGLSSFGGADRGMSSVHAQAATPTPILGTIINCAPGQPCIDLHGERTEVVLGDAEDLVAFSLSILNSLVQPEMTVSLRLQAPSGWSLSGEGFANECSSQCSATYRVSGGEQKFVEFTGRPNQVGQFRFQGNLEWFFEGGTEVYGHTETISVTVYPGEVPQPPPTPTPEPPNGNGPCTEKRGLFFNCVEGSNWWDDPRTLPVLGIVLALVTILVQLWTGRRPRWSRW